MQTLLRFHQFSTNILFHVLGLNSEFRHHVFLISICELLFFTTFDSFQEYWSGVLHNILKLGLPYYFFFLMIILGLWILGRKTTEVKQQFYKGHLLATWFKTVDFHLDNLAEVVFIQILHHCKLFYLICSIPILYFWR